jgi:hypothetical protein
MSYANDSRRGTADEALTAVVEYTTAADNRHRVCFYIKEDSLDRVEQRMTDGDWRTSGTAQVENLSIRLVDTEAGISTQEGVEQ